jgi:hypothetical protein
LPATRHGLAPAQLANSRIEFERGQIGARGLKRRGERAGPGTDLDDPVARRIDGEARDARCDRAVHEKILTEALLRTDSVCRKQRARVHGAAFGAREAYSGAVFKT